ncbi:hypothetical protein [Lacticaseibacillus nasuensis]|uniref:Uncharacterized protein n=1 Tax=Lacticaseibacillus nasuensis JCM 17158 TaxID=1291734 RepID=A0A0R1K0K0_9LACO|nr:hypothetical protein [Lacticaseibacillus nasuensis]KRK72887.1 hypothetical protein FD02_GL001305 [Lacticaseibacillus nasuensis JCM 17158]
MKLTLTVTALPPHRRTALSSLDLLAAWPKLPRRSLPSVFASGGQGLLAVVPVPEEKSTIIVDYHIGPYRVEVKEPTLWQALHDAEFHLKGNAALTAAATAQYQAQTGSNKPPETIALGGALLIGCAGDNHRPNILVNARFFQQVTFSDDHPQTMAVTLKFTGGTCILACDYTGQVRLSQPLVRARFNYARALSATTWPAQREILKPGAGQAVTATVPVSKMGAQSLAGQSTPAEIARKVDAFRDDMRLFEVPVPYRQKLAQSVRRLLQE